MENNNLNQGNQVDQNVGLGQKLNGGNTEILQPEVGNVSSSEITPQTPIGVQPQASVSTPDVAASPSSTVVSPNIGEPVVQQTQNEVDPSMAIPNIDLQPSVDPVAVNVAQQPNVSPDGINPNLVNQVSTNMEVGNNELPKEESPKKKSKLPIIIGVIIVVILLACGGVYLYLKNTYTADKFLSNNYESINTFMSSNLSNTITIDSNILNQDIITSGTITIDDYTLEYDINLALGSEYIKMNLDYLENNTSIIDGSIYLKSNMLYIKSSDIYEYPLKYDLEENYFDYIDTSEFDEYNIDYVSAVKNLVKYLYEAIDASDKTSTISGTTAVYTYSINENNLNSINNTFINSIESDEDMSKLLDLLEIDVNDFSLFEMEITITQNIFDGEIISFAIDDLIGNKTNDGEYTISTVEDGTYFIVNYTDTSFSIVYYEDGVEYLNITVENTDTTASMILSTEDTSISLYATFIDQDTTNVTLSVLQGDETVSLNANINAISDTNFSIDGSIDANVEDYNYTIDFTNNTEFGENLVLVESINNAVDINNISDEEAYIIYYNLMSIYYALDLSSYSLSM